MSVRRTVPKGCAPERSASGERRHHGREALGLAHDEVADAGRRPEPLHLVDDLLDAPGEDERRLDEQRPVDLEGGASSSSAASAPDPTRVTWTNADRSMSAERSPAASSSHSARRSTSANRKPPGLGAPPSPWVSPVNWKMSANRPARRTTWRPWPPIRNGTWAWTGRTPRSSTASRWNSPSTVVPPSSSRDRSAASDSAKRRTRDRAPAARSRWRRARTGRSRCRGRARAARR